MYSAINPATSRLFPQLPASRRLTATDFTTPQAAIPKTQSTISVSEKTPPPAREVLMAAALAYQGPILAKMFIQESKKEEQDSIEPVLHNIAA